MRSVLRGSLGLDAALEDLLQEVFIVFLRRAPELREAASLRAFLTTVAVRLVLVELRRRKVRRWVTLSRGGTLPEVGAAPGDVDGQEALRGLYRLLERLPSRRRLAFVLRHVQGFDVSEVASALEISESTVKREIAHARRVIFKRAERGEPTLWQYLERFSGERHG